MLRELSEFDHFYFLSGHIPQIYLRAESAIWKISSVMICWGVTLKGSRDAMFVNSIARAAISRVMMGDFGVAKRLELKLASKVS